MTVIESTCSIDAYRDFCSSVFFSWWALVERSCSCLCKGLISKDFETWQMAPGFWTSGVFDLSKLHILTTSPGHCGSVVKPFVFLPNCLFIHYSRRNVKKKKKNLLTDTFRLILGDSHTVVCPFMQVILGLWPVHAQVSYTSKEVYWLLLKLYLFISVKSRYINILQAVIWNDRQLNAVAPFRKCPSWQHISN